MNIWNKVLLSFILVASLAFMYLAVKDLKLHRKWGEEAKTYLGTEGEPGSIETELKLQDKLINGVTDGEPGIRQLSVEVNKLMLERGRAWFNCQPTGFSQNPPFSQDQPGFAVKTSLPDPHGITAKSVVYVFEQKAAGQGGSYLGQFAVVGVADQAVAPQMVQLQPSRQLSPQEIQRAMTSQQTPNMLWAMFETLPVDDPDAFQGLTEEQVRTLPAGVVAEYIDNAQEHKLRDYEIYFREAHRLRSQTADMLAAATRDKQYLDEANADAKLQEQFRGKEFDDLKVESAGVHREAEAVIVHRDNLRGKVNAMRTAITETIQENNDLAGEIAKRQLDASRKIDEQPLQRVAQVAGT